MTDRSILMFLLLAFCSAASAEQTTFDPVPQKVLLQYLAGKGDFVLIDARSAEEYTQGHIYGAKNVPHDSDLAKTGDLPTDRAAPIVVYCKSGTRAGQLRDRMRSLGYTNVRVLGPDQMLWSDNLPVFNCGPTVATKPAAESVLIEKTGGNP